MSSTPSHYLNQQWLIVNWTLGNKLQRNFNQNTFIIQDVLKCQISKWQPFCLCLNVLTLIRIGIRHEISDVIRTPLYVDTEDSKISNTIIGYFSWNKDQYHIWENTHLILQQSSAIVTKSCPQVYATRGVFIISIFKKMDVSLSDSQVYTKLIIMQESDGYLAMISQSTWHPHCLIAIFYIHLWWDIHNIRDGNQP